MGGGGNPIEDVQDFAEDAVDTAVRVGVGSTIGAVSEIGGIGKDAGEAAGAITGEITGKNDRLREEAEKKQGEAIKQEEVRAQEREVAAEQAKEENLDRARVARGRSRSRTLLTGGQGVSEEEDKKNISRRTLLGS